MTLDVQGDLRDWLREAQALHPDRLQPELNERWAQSAAEHLRDFVGGGPVTHYLTFRTGGAQRSVQATASATRATVSVTGPGMNVLEEGTGILPSGAITPKAGRYLTFRIHRPWDGAEATGPWIRTTRVVIKPRYMVRDAATQALQGLDGWLDDLLETA